jgi:transcriptional regulator with XRE-family HTH domain
MKIEPLTPNDAILDELGQRLARVRKQQGRSQEQLASDAGLGVATLRRIESGQDSQLESWLKLLKALHMTAAIDQLLPEHYASPMAEAQAAKKRARSDAGGGIAWGDES